VGQVVVHQEVVVEEVAERAVADVVEEPAVRRSSSISAADGAAAKVARSEG